MLKDLKKNKQGIVFVTVLMIIIVMTVLTLSVISMNVSQYMISEGEVKRIQAEVLGMGALAYILANQLSTDPSNSITYTARLDNVTFLVNAEIGGAGQGPLSTDLLNIDVSY